MTAPTVPVPRVAEASSERAPFCSEATAAAGLLVVPDVAGGAYTGRWRLRSAATGAAITSATSLAYAREVATLLADTGIDWNQPNRTPAAVAALERAAAACRAACLTRAPLWWGRSSWVSHAPLWRVGIGDDVLTVPFAQLWWLLDHLPADEVHIGYNPAPTWTLRCAAPLCTDDFGDVVVLTSRSDWDEDQGTGLPLRHADRTVLTVEAVAAAWSRHGNRWLCRGCALAHVESPSITW